MMASFSSIFSLAAQEQPCSALSSPSPYYTTLLMTELMSDPYTLSPNP